MDFTRILIVLITLQALGLGIAGLPQVRDTPDPSRGMDIADLKSSMDAILGDAKSLIARPGKPRILWSDTWRRLTVHRYSLAGSNFTVMIRLNS